MRLAIMQPYIFPYIGYFQLINAVDKFVLFDDVNYINKGWINRNRIIANKKEYLFTIPLKAASQNKLIKDIEISYETPWKNKFLKTIEMAYKKAPLFNTAFPLIETVVSSGEQFITGMVLKSINEINKYLNIKTSVIPTSSIYNNQSLKGQMKIVNICKQEQATEYINPIGGRDIYSEQSFAKEGIILKFIKSIPIEYKQLHNGFIPWLSIIDVLMLNQKEQIINFLNEYELR